MITPNGEKVDSEIECLRAFRTPGQPYVRWFEFLDKECEEKDGYFTLSEKGRKLYEQRLKEAEKRVK